MQKIQMDYIGIANLSIVTSEQWNDKATGQRQEKAECHRVVIFGKLAEVASKYLTKGLLVYLEGKLQTRKWQDQNTGQDRYSTEVVLSGFDGKMEMLGDGSSPQNQAPTSVLHLLWHSKPHSNRLLWHSNRTTLMTMCRFGVDLM